MHVISSGPEEMEDVEDLGDYYEEIDVDDLDPVADRRFFGGGGLFHKDKHPKHYEIPYGHSGYDDHSGYGHSGYDDHHSGYGGHHSVSGYGYYDDHGHGHGHGHGHHYGYGDEPLVEFGLPYLGSLGLFKGGQKKKRRPPPVLTKGKPPGPLLVVKKRDPKKPDSFLHDLVDGFNDLIFGHPTIFFTLLGTIHI